MKDDGGNNSKYIGDRDKLRLKDRQIRYKKHSLARCCLKRYTLKQRYRKG